jgi:nucleolar protein 53
MPLIKPLTASPGAPQQPKQPSRKGKRAWRKNVDVSEIQDGLEVVRDEVIKGYVPTRLYWMAVY